MLLKVTDAKYIKGHILELSFSNGYQGKVNLLSSLQGPVFQPLQELENFKKFTVTNWTVEWDNGADLAPEYLYNLALEQNKEKEKVQ